MIDAQALHPLVKHYPRSYEVIAHLLSVLEPYDSLHPRVEAFTFDDGRSQLLLCLGGTIPVVLRQNTYNCPLALWLPLEYPSKPPITLILPTSSMQIKRSKSVDPNGKVTISYLEEWERKGEGSSLLSLLDALKDQFGREYPLVSTAARPPPAPVASTSRSSPPISRQFDQQQPSRPPPLPSYNRPSPEIPRLPQQNRSWNQVEEDSSRAPQNYSIASNSPTLSVRSQSGLPALNPYESNRPPPNPYSRSQSIPAPNLSYAPQPQSPQQYLHQSNSYSSQTQSYQPPPAPPPNRPLQYRPQPTPAPSQRSIVNILDGPDDPFSPSASLNAPPPLPPNPELLAMRAQLHAKLSHALAQLTASTHEQMNQLSLIEADLRLGEPAIADESQRLEAVRGVCNNVRDRYAEVIQQGEKRLAEYRTKGEGTEIDEIVCSTTVVYNQFLDLVAEDAALEDTIYHLGRGLSSDTANIDLDRFLKRVRGLAIKQFEKRHLINQILTGLPDILQ